MSGVSVKAVAVAPFFCLSLLVLTYFMMFPLLPLLFVNPQWFRLLVNRLAAFWSTFCCAICQLIFGMKFVVTGDGIAHSSGSNILIMNHRTRMDWVFIRPALLALGYRHMMRIKMVPKVPVRPFLLIGFVCQFLAEIFLWRGSVASWKSSFDKKLQLFKTLGEQINVLLFPEGTVPFPPSIAKSDEYAISHGLPKYKYVIHPRVTGFTYLTKAMLKEQELCALYDITMAFLPEAKTPLNLYDPMFGMVPQEIHFHIKRYPASELPKGNDGLAKFCQQRWKEKEQRLEQFYKQNKQCSSEMASSECISDGSISLQKKLMLVATFIFWCTSAVIMVYKALTSIYVLVYLGFAYCTLSYFDKVYRGLDEYQFRWVSSQAPRHLTYWVRPCIFSGWEWESTK